RAGTRRPGRALVGGERIASRTRDQPPSVNRYRRTRYRDRKAVESMRGGAVEIFPVLVEVRDVAWTLEQLRRFAKRHAASEVCAPLIDGHKSACGRALALVDAHP